MLNRETIAARIIKFAQDNNLKIHPGQNPLKWADLVIKRGGHCPCVRDRDHCPCDFVLEDIKEMNRCRCGLYVNETYIKEYSDLVSKRRGR
jgi:hypothetical protein